VEDWRELPAAILAAARPGDVVVTMGAGSIGQVPALLRQAVAVHPAEQVHGHG
jgi:UDP-N-acetylmuramate--alanine ligase